MTTINPSSNYNPATPEGQEHLQTFGVPVLATACYQTPVEEDEPTDEPDDIDGLFDWCFDVARNGDKG